MSKNKTTYPGGCFGGCGDTTPYKTKVDAANVCFDPAGSCNEIADNPVKSTNVQAALHELICHVNNQEDCYVEKGFIQNQILNLCYSDADKSPIQIDLSGLPELTVNGGSFNASTLVLTLTDNDPQSPDINVPLGDLISVMTDNGDGTYTHQSGDGSVTLIDTNSNPSTITDNGNGVYTHDDGQGNLTQIDTNTADTNSSVINNGDGTYTHVSGDGVSVVIDTKTPHAPSSVVSQNSGHVVAVHNDGNGAAVNIEETITEVTVNADGGFTFTDEAGAQITVPGQPVSQVVSNNSGNAIASHNDGSGNVTDIFETVTSWVNNGDGTYTYSSEDGTDFVLDTTVAHVPSSLTNNGDGTFTHDNGSGNSVTVDMCADCPDVLTRVDFDAQSNSFTYTDEAGNATVVPLGTVDVQVTDASLNGLMLTITDSDGSSESVDFSALISTLTDNGDGTYTHVSGDGSSTTIDTNSNPSNVTDNGDGTYTHNDGNGSSTVIDTNTPHNPSTITDNGDGTYTHDDGNGVSAVIDTNTPHNPSSLVDNGDGTYTHSDGEGNSTIIDTNSTASSVVDNGDGTYTHDNGDGDTTTIDTNGITVTDGGSNIADTTDADNVVIQPLLRACDDSVFDYVNDRMHEEGTSLFAFDSQEGQVVIDDVQLADIVENGPQVIQTIRETITNDDPDGCDWVVKGTYYCQTDVRFAEDNRVSLGWNVDATASGGVSLVGAPFITYDERFRNSGNATRAYPPVFRHALGRIPFGTTATIAENLTLTVNNYNPNAANRVRIQNARLQFIIGRRGKL